MAPETTIHRRASTDEALPGEEGTDRPDGPGRTDGRDASGPPDSPGGRRAAEPTASEPAVRTITGPHAGYDRYGRYDHRFYRCERCGVESTDPGLRTGCPRCDRDRRDEATRPRRGGPSREVTAADA